MSDEKPTFAETREKFREVASQTDFSMTQVEKLAKKAAKGIPAPKDVSKAFGGHENLAIAGQVVREHCNFKNRNCGPN